MCRRHADKIFAPRSGRRSLDESESADLPLVAAFGRIGDCHFELDIKPTVVNAKQWQIQTQALNETLFDSCPRRFASDNVSRGAIRVFEEVRDGIDDELLVLCEAVDRGLIFFIFFLRLRDEVAA